MGDVWLKEVDTVLELPEKHHILKVGLDPRGYLCVWILLDISLVSKRILVRGTWDNCEDIFAVEDPSSHLGIVIDGAYVWHVFTGKIECLSNM